VSAPRPLHPSVHWVSAGQGDALLLVNGWSASGLAWPASWLRMLERDFTVIRMDNRGSGWSRQAPSPFTVGDLANDAHAVLGAAGFHRATVLGLSMGGMVAQELAMRHPAAVSRLILAATRPPAPAATLGNPALLAGAMRRPRTGQDLHDYFRALWSDFTAPDFAATHPDLMTELVDQIVRRPTPRHAVLAQVRAMSAWHGARRLSTITAPTTVIHGALDPLIPVANGRRLARLIPEAAYVEVPDVGHLLAHEAPDMLTQELSGRASTSARRATPSGA